MDQLRLQEKRKLAWASTLLIVTLTGSNILGMIRDRILVTFFPTTQLDIYYASFRIPDLIYNLLVLGALSSAFIPIFTTYLAKNNKEEAYRLASNVLWIGLLILGVLSAILMVLAPQLVPIIAPGFTGPKRELAIRLTRILLIAPLFFGISGIFGGILNSFKRFITYSIAPLAYNLGIIFGAVVLRKYFGIYGLGLGVVLGAFCHGFIQFLELLKIRFPLYLIFRLNHPGVKKIGLLMIPRTIGLAASQIALIVQNVIGSLLSAGSIAIINLATNIYTVPMAIFGSSYAIALFPNLAEKAAQERKEEFINDLSWGIRKILFWIIPSAIGIFLLRNQIIRLILGSKQFSWSDTKLTAAALGIFCGALLGQSIIPLLARAFFAFHDTKTPVLISIFSSLLTVGLSYLLTQNQLSEFYFQILKITNPLLKAQTDPRVLGLPLACSVGSLINLFLLLLFLRQKLGSLEGGRILKSGVKMLIASVFMGIFVYFSLRLVSVVFKEITRPLLFIALQVLVAVLGGFLVYLLAAYMLSIEEIRQVKKNLLDLFFRNKLVN